MKKNISDKKINKKIDIFLKDNPQLKEALNVFNMSISDYRKAMESVTRKTTVTTFNTTNTYGNMAGNSK